MNLGILVLFLALILFGVLAFKQLSAPILGPVVTIFVIVCFRMPILDSLKTMFMPAAASYFTSYFLVFFVGALFGAVYQHTGAAKSIAKFLASKSQGKFVAPIIMVITGILTYGGVSGFVVFFVIYPIAQHMFHRASVSRRLIPAAISSGCWTWSMYGPGSPAIQNIIPMNNLGTSSLAGGAGAVIATVASFIMIFVWLEYRARRYQKLGYGFQDDKMTFKLDPSEIAEDDPNEDLPNPYLCFVPIIVILITFNVPIFGGKPLAVETAVLLGVVLSIIFFWKRVAGGVNGWLQVLNEGAANSGVAILNTSIVVGFGGVVKNTQGFTDLVAALKNLNMSPLVFVMITVAVCAGACGSASGGLGVAFSALKDTYVEMGLNLAHVHRISSIAAGTLDSLPHQGAQITLLGICKCTHKESYFDIFITQIVIPFISCFIFIACAAAGLAG